MKVIKDIKLGIFLQFLHLFLKIFKSFHKTLETNWNESRFERLGNTFGNLYNYTFVQLKSEIEIFATKSKVP